jgi:cell division protein FtsB
VSNNLVEGRPAGAVDLGGSAKAASVGYSAADAMAVSIVRLYQEGDELRATVAMLQEQARILAEERDEARIQYRSTEALAMALVKTIEELKTEKAELFVQLVNLQSGSRRATLDEIAESVREKYDERHEGEGMENE